jgi:hypothetical protein
MKPWIAKHQDATDKVFVLTSGTRVWVHGREKDYYVVIAVKNGRQFSVTRSDFKNPEELPF